ncbi:MAG TPA: flavodoxin [Candidatus Limosilactobacillus merdigallinarum]|uniref:Flavodoxin n=1 Tax=Candidatus Limosilactobacillus merdigallinarum TaxID=2838652 RepID=A0A9D1VGI3_9LACO|nr:flavodoxin [Candidatus Limosilactobacillus merdigallinarum]
MAKTLILYYSATGTTEKMAKEVAEKLGADIQAIHPVQPYSQADLNWHDKNSRTSIEQHQHDSRVEVKDDFPDLINYDNVIIAHPIWWGIPPRMISDVIDKLDLNGNNLTGFAISDGSDYSRCQSYLQRAVEQNHYDVHLLEGTVLNSPAQADKWLAGLNF